MAAMRAFLLLSVARASVERQECFFA